jgi:hypothetical protein
MRISLALVALAACTNGIDTGPITPDASTSATGNQAAVTYEGKLDSITPVPFGGPPDTACNYTQGMDHLVLDLLIKPTGDVIGGAMQNHNVETIVGTCQFAPAAPSDVSYSLANASAGQLTFTGAADNHPQAALTIQLTQTQPQTYAAALTIHRTDLTGTFAWTVTANLTLTPKP